jgi:hypothetical protein
MSEEDLRYAVLDLYKKSILQTQILLTIAPTTTALVNSLRELDPDFAEVYARHFEAEQKQKTIQGIALMADLLSQAIQVLEKKWGIKVS